MSRRNINNAGYWFVLPTFALFLLFLVLPMLNSFRLSLFQWDLLGPKKWVGLRQFADLLGDRDFLRSWGRTLYYTLVSSALLIVLSFVTALLLDSRRLHPRGLFQAVYFLPVVLVTPAVAVVWKLMFQTTGILNAAVSALFGVSIPWLDSEGVALYSIVMVQLWISLGYYMVMFIAGLQNIPMEYHESAMIDGASWLSRLLAITIPLLRPTVVLVLVTCIIFVFGQFAVPFVISHGGPNYATELLTLFIYRNAFNYLKVGFASAASVFYFLTMLGFSIVQIRIFQGRDREAGV
jgi:ABC-type sugar transport system permease subunit